jgi:hypothetical protein
MLPNVTPDSIGRYYELWRDDGSSNSDCILTVSDMVRRRGGFNWNKRLECRAVTLELTISVYKNQILLRNLVIL